MHTLIPNSQFIPPPILEVEPRLWRKLSTFKAAFETGMASENYHSSLRKIHGNLQFLINHAHTQKYKGLRNITLNTRVVNAYNLCFNLQKGIDARASGYSQGTTTRLRTKEQRSN